MRHLIDYIKEELFSTPANTLGMGNPLMPSLPDLPGELTPDNEVGSGDTFQSKKPRKTKRKPTNQKD